MAKSRHDEVKEKFYRPLEQIECFIDITFWSSVVLSFAVILINEQIHAELNAFLKILFLISSILTFALSLITRFYFFPRAHDARTENFISHAFNTSLSQEITIGYYNNNEFDPIKKTGAQLLENCFFSKEGSRKLCVLTRWKFGIYLLIWLAVVFWRKTSLDLVVTISQVLLSEQIIAKVVSLEWFRMKSERIYEAVSNVFLLKSQGNEFSSVILSNLVKYESAKSTYGGTLSDGIFNKYNTTWSRQWEDQKKRLGIL